MTRVSTVITDVDNTLYDWVAMWYASFGAMLAELVALSGLPQDRLEREIRPIFQRQRTSEYSFVIQEIPSLRAMHPGENLAEVYEPAIDAYREARDRTLALYPTVGETLRSLKDAGCLLVAYTESQAYHTRDRIKRVGLDGVLDFMYSPQDHDIPPGISVDEIRSRPDDHYELQETVHRTLPPHVRKPDAEVLVDIVEEVGADPDRCVYVGDSLMKDISMAQAAGIVDVYAAYGIAQHREEYELLRRVSWWTEAEVERERELMSRPSVTPTHTLENRMAELLELFEFGGEA